VAVGGDVGLENAGQACFASRPWLTSRVSQTKENAQQGRIRKPQNRNKTDTNIEANDHNGNKS
jgi:hypothetical protein